MAEHDTTPDLSFIPDTFRGEDGAPDLDGFKSHFEDLSAFKAQTDEAKAALPEAPEGYKWGVGDEFEWPEGFDPQAFRQPVLKEDGTEELDKDGNPVSRDLSPDDVFDPNDPDIPLLQEILHKHGANPALTQDLAKIMMARELRTWREAGEQAAQEKQKLGPNPDARIATISRTLRTRLSADQAKAVLDGLTSADALRGMENIIKSNGVPPSPIQSGTKDYSSMSIDERIDAGMKNRA